MFQQQRPDPRPFLESDIGIESLVQAKFHRKGQPQDEQFPDSLDREAAAKSAKSFMFCSCD